MSKVYPKYRKKPIDIEALQVRPSIWSWRDCLEFMQIDEEYIDGHAMSMIATARGIEVVTKEGPKLAVFDDYIIRGVMGDYFVCKAAEFEKYYEQIEETPKKFGDIKEDFNVNET